VVEPGGRGSGIDRAHRIGQDKPVQVYRLVVGGAVEERVRELQARKRELAGSLYDEEGQALAQVGEEEVAALLAPLEG